MLSDTGRSHWETHSTAWLKATVIFFVIFYTANGALERFAELANSENPLRNRLIFVLVWCACVYVVLAAAYLESLVLRAFYATIVAISTFSSEAYKGIANSQLSYGEIYSLWLSRDEWKSALQNYWQAALPSLGLALLVWAAITMPAHFSSRRLRIAKWARYGFVVPFILIALMVEKKGGAAALGLPEQVNASAMFAHVAYFDATNDFDAIRKSVEIRPQRATAVQPHLVLIIDESVRGDFLSINNPAAQTTPFLESQSSRLANFGYASTTHDCSHYANANLRYGTHSTDPSNSLRTNPSIWEYAKSAGYQTTYIDAQRRLGQMQNFMSPRERRSIDKFIQFDEVDAVERSEAFVLKDQHAADLLKSILSRTIPQFVILNKEGAHAPYEGKYPEIETKFAPKMSLAESIHLGLSREKLVNSYRNAISWGVDKFFSHLLSSGFRLDNAILIYTGDHGQNLLNKGTPTHCGSPTPPNVVGLVPLFAITDHSAFRDELSRSAKRNINKASHFNIFPTLLLVMGYRPSEFGLDYDQDLTSELSGVRFWFTGDILGNTMVKHDFHFDSSEAEPH